LARLFHPILTALEDDASGALEDLADVDFEAFAELSIMSVMIFLSGA
jgi:hypothetical protein